LEMLYGAPSSYRLVVHLCRYAHTLDSTSTLTASQTGQTQLFWTGVLSGAERPQCSMDSTSHRGVP
jgi:hypothetical protein